MSCKRTRHSAREYFFVSMLHVNTLWIQVCIYESIHFQVMETPRTICIRFSRVSNLFFSLICVHFKLRLILTFLIYCKRKCLINWQGIRKNDLNFCFHKVWLNLNSIEQQSKEPEKKMKLKTRERKKMKSISCEFGDGHSIYPTRYSNQRFYGSDFTNFEKMNKWPDNSPWFC